ncbi:MAG: response regulator [Chloroflexota bacterium]
MGNTAEAGEVAARGSVSRRVLVVDDNPDLCDFLADCLQAAGYYPIQAHDGLSGWQALNEHHPDVAVVDLSMPVMSGFRLLWLLRVAKPIHTPHVPVVVISGHDPQEASDVIATRPEAYLVKPFAAERFLTAVREAIESRVTQSVG